MAAMTLVLRWLDFMGRYATIWLALGVGIGLAVPPLAALARPLLPAFIVLPLSISLMRIDWGELIDYSRRWPLVVLMCGWLMLASPVLVWAVLAPTGLPEPLVIGIVLMAAAPPIVSAAAFALILNLDAAIAVVGTVAAMWLTPLLLPPIALILLDLEIDISLWQFALRLGVFVVVAFGLGWLGRRLLGPRRLQSYRPTLDGIAVLSLLCFAIAVMDGVAAELLARPGFVLLATAMGFLFNLALQAAGAALFWRTGRRAALSVGIMSGNCNMGLMLVVLADRAHFDTVIFFAMAQVPMYTLPAILLPLYRRLGRMPVPSA